MSIAVIIVGIDGFEQYTLPLVESLLKYEPDCWMLVIDNASTTEYPHLDDELYPRTVVTRTPRFCYSGAINVGHSLLTGNQKGFDWYIVLSNDVLCTGPFAHLLEKQDGEAVIGPLMRSVHGFEYIEGWCVCIPRKIWDRIGGWDENYLGSDYEDVDYSTMARESGFFLEEVPELPFKHLDQRQRYHVVEDFAAKDAQNSAYFLRKHAGVVA